MKTYTPWGEAQEIYPCGDSGIFKASCASHGGYYVPDELLKTMPASLKCNFYGGKNWFEEDCEWALVVLAFPHLFEVKHIEAAVKTMQTESNPAETYYQAYCWLQTPAGQRVAALARIPEAIPAQDMPPLPSPTSAHGLAAVGVKR